MDSERIAVLASALSHPDRVRLLDRLQRVDELSPRQFAEGDGAPLGNVAYHVRALREAGLIEQVRTMQRRGAVEHFYALTTTGRAVLAWAQKAPASDAQGG